MKVELNIIYSGSWISSSNSGMGGTEGGVYGSPDEVKAPDSLRNLAVAKRPFLVPRRTPGSWSQDTAVRMCRWSQ